MEHQIISPSPQRIHWQQELTTSPKARPSINPKRPSNYAINALKTTYDPEHPRRNLASPPPPHPRHSFYLRLLVDCLGFNSGGWRGGSTCCAIITVTVLLINISLTAWASSSCEPKDGLGTLYRGSCDLTKVLSLVAHIFINGLSTALLAASNYTMQCLSAPTRAEVDKAHANKKWLDIGIPSVKNLGRINKFRLLLWLLLGISSVPLHFMYNSAVFPTISSYDYIIRVVAEENVPRNYTSSNFERLENRECMKAYGKQFISDRRDLVVVVSGNGTKDMGTYNELYSEIKAGGRMGPKPYNWICKSFDYHYSTSDGCKDNNPLSRDDSGVGMSGTYEKCESPKGHSIDLNTCKIDDLLPQANSWAVNGTAVRHCLSEKRTEECSLQYSLHIMVLVIICNAVKSLCMFLAVLKIKGSGDPLVTVGDAIASFLNTPDETTTGMCIVSKREIENGIWVFIQVTTGDTHEQWYPYLWKTYRPFWFRAASTSRWVICNALALVAIITTLGILLAAYHQRGIPHDVSFLWDVGFGAIDVRVIAAPPFRTDRGYQDLIICVLIANLPQVTFSFLYLLYNSIFTCMLLAEEWDKFSCKLQPLRVSEPIGAQRSTHFLQLPYRYSLPLMAASGLMHWLISQSIFLARITVFHRERGPIHYLPTGAESITTISNIGWSPIAITSALILAGLMLAAVNLNGFRRYGGKIPLVGNCSAAISAACHPDRQGPPIATLPLMWGVINTNGEFRHCSFSSKKVPGPAMGQRYVGNTTVGNTLGRDKTQVRGIRKDLVRERSRL